VRAPSTVEIQAIAPAPSAESRSAPAEAAPAIPTPADGVGTVSHHVWQIRIAYEVVAAGAVDVAAHGCVGDGVVAKLSLAASTLIFRRTDKRRIWRPQRQHRRTANDGNDAASWTHANNKAPGHQWASQFLRFPQHPSPHWLHLSLLRRGLLQLAFATIDFGARKEAVTQP